MAYSLTVNARLPLMVCLFVAVGYVAGLIVLISLLPDRIASHFNAAGEANGWMQSSGFFPVALGTGLGVPAFVLGITFVIRFFPSSMLNVPHADYWRSPENYPRACAILFDWACWFAVVSMLWSAAMNVLVFLANRLPAPLLDNNAVFAVSGLYVGFLFGSVIWLVLRFWRKPDQGMAAAA